jgi:integrase
MERLQSVKEQRNEFHAQRVLSIFYQYCSTLGLAPEDVIEISKTDPEKIFDYTTKFLAKLAEEGYEINSKVAELQTLQKWLYAQLLPPWIEQSEYKGKYTSAELSLETREEMVRELINICLNYSKYDRDVCKLSLKSWIFLYYTGSRAESLTNFTVEQKIKVTWEKFKDVYGTNEFVVVKTTEKGKKGKKYEWRKLIPIQWSHLIPEKTLRKKELEKVRALTRTVLLKLISRYGTKLFNNDTIRYILGEELEGKKRKRKQGRVLHIWRHTFAREALKAFGWNTYLVSKLGGWVKESNLRIYGDYDLLSLIQASSEKHQMIFVREGMKKMIISYGSLDIIASSINFAISSIAPPNDSISLIKISLSLKNFSKILLILSSLQYVLRLKCDLAPFTNTQSSQNSNINSFLCLVIYPINSDARADVLSTYFCSSSTFFNFSTLIINSFNFATNSCFSLIFSPE